MHPDLAVRRRAVFVVYRRFLEADQAWHDACVQMNAWFPPSVRTRAAAIGHPGSRIRQLYNQRERAIAQLEVARLKLDIAKKRLARQRRPGTRRVMLLTAR